MTGQAGQDVKKEPLKVKHDSIAAKEEQKVIEAVVRLSKFSGLCTILRNCLYPCFLSAGPEESHQAPVNPREIRERSCQKDRSACRGSSRPRENYYDVSSNLTCGPPQSPFPYFYSNKDPERAKKRQREDAEKLYREEIRAREMEEREMKERQNAERLYRAERRARERRKIADREQNKDDLAAIERECRDERDNIRRSPTKSQASDSQQRRRVRELQSAGRSFRRRTSEEEEEEEEEEDAAEETAAETSTSATRGFFNWSWFTKPPAAKRKPLSSSESGESLEIVEEEQLEAPPDRDNVPVPEIEQSAASVAATPPVRIDASGMEGSGRLSAAKKSTLTFCNQPGYVPSKLPAPPKHGQVLAPKNYKRRGQGSKISHIENREYEDYLAEEREREVAAKIRERSRSDARQRSKRGNAGKSRHRRADSRSLSKSPSWSPSPPDFIDDSKSTTSSSSSSDSHCTEPDRQEELEEHCNCCYCKDQAKQKIRKLLSGKAKPDALGDVPFDMDVDYLPSGNPNPFCQDVAGKYVYIKHIELIINGQSPDQFQGGGNRFEAWKDYVRLIEVQGQMKHNVNNSISPELFHRNCYIACWNLSTSLNSNYEFIQPAVHKIHTMTVKVTFSDAIPCDLELIVWTELCSSMEIDISKKVLQSYYNPFVQNGGVE